WLAFGQAGSGPKKVFQFCHRADVPIEVVGQRLHASLKPLEGRIIIESNGGTATVPVRVTVPTTPFPDGGLQGALTPRQLAEKAKAAPKAAAAYFEGGAVAEWYAANGWIYPVRVPVASGLAAVQQYFEALSLVKPPRVAVATEGVRLGGEPGEAVSHILWA